MFGDFFINYSFSVQDNFNLVGKLFTIPPLMIMICFIFSYEIFLIPKAFLQNKTALLGTLNKNFNREHRALNFL